MKAVAFERKPIEDDTKSNGNYRNSTSHPEETALKSIAFNKKSVAFDTKTN